MSFTDEQITKLQAIFCPETKEKVSLPPVQWFNVHKRSLPPALDRIAVYGVTQAEGEWLILNKLKAKVCDNNEGSEIIYFDLVPVDATLNERSIYHNPSKVLKD